MSKNNLAPREWLLCYIYSYFDREMLIMQAQKLQGQLRHRKSKMNAIGCSNSSELLWIQNLSQSLANFQTKTQVEGEPVLITRNFQTQSDLAHFPILKFLFKKRSSMVKPIGRFIWRTDFTHPLFINSAKNGIISFRQSMPKS